MALGSLHFPPHHAGARNGCPAGQETGPVFIHSTLPDGLQAALASPFPSLAAGSLFLLGDLKALLRHAEKRSTAQ